MASLTKEERQTVARRVFEALCAHYPDRHIVLVEKPGSPDAEARPTTPEPLASGFVTAKGRLEEARQT
jgi:hypothetical protein